MNGKPKRTTETTRDRARQLRRDSTFPEKRLWGVLRNRSLEGLKFRRQHPIGPFVVDFFCREASLIVEVDGESHTDRHLADGRRQRYLEEQGFQVFRVTNDDILEDLEAVARAIAWAAGASCE